jgi:hypothetical protein
MGTAACQPGSTALPIGARCSAAPPAATRRRISARDQKLFPDLWRKYGGPMFKGGLDYFAKLSSSRSAILATREDPVMLDEFAAQNQR